MRKQLTVLVQFELTLLEGRLHFFSWIKGSQSEGRPLEGALLSERKTKERSPGASQMAYSASSFPSLESSSRVLMSPKRRHYLPLSLTFFRSRPDCASQTNTTNQSNTCMFVLPLYLYSLHIRVGLVELSLKQ